PGELERVSRVAFGGLKRLRGPIRPLGRGRTRLASRRRSRARRPILGGRLSRVLTEQLEECRTCLEPRLATERLDLDPGFPGIHEQPLRLAQAETVHEIVE